MKPFDTFDLIQLNDSDDIKASTSIDYLLRLDINEIIENKKASQALYCLRHAIDNGDVLLTRDFQIVLSNILLKLSELKSELIIDKNIFDFSEVTSETEHIICLIYLILLIINIAGKNSVTFLSKFLSKKGLESIFVFIKDKNFLEKILDVEISENGENNNLIESLFLNLAILSKYSEDNLNKWKELDAIKTLLELIELKESIKFDIYLTIINIADDKQIEDLPEILKILNHIKEKLNEMISNIENDRCQSFIRQINDDGEIKDVLVHVVSDGGYNTPMLTYLDCLYRLLLNDKFRFEILSDSNFYKSLKLSFSMIYDIEIKFTLKLFVQLSFNSVISQQFYQDTEFLNLLKNIENSKEKSISNMCQLIFNNVEAVNPSKFHVMISFDPSNKDFGFKLRKKLELLGFCICDSNDTSTSTGNLIKSIENSYLVIICVNEKYRLSIECQAHVTIAARLNKPIIGLIVQKGYECVAGWIGKSLKNFCCIDCVDLDVENLTKELVLKIDENMKNLLEPKINNNNVKFESYEKVKRILKDQVNKLQDNILAIEEQKRDLELSNKELESILDKKINILYCPICFVKVDDNRPLYAIECGHIICEICLNSINRQFKNCPFCRGSTVQTKRLLFP